MIGIIDEGDGFRRVLVQRAVDTFKTFIIADEQNTPSEGEGDTNDAGRFVTSMDLFFSAKDDTTC